MIHVTLDDDLADHLIAAVEMWLDGYDSSVTAIGEDRCIADIDILLSMISDMHDQYDKIMRLKLALEEARNVISGTSSPV